MRESHTAVHGRLSRIQYRRTKGRASRRRDESISNKLKQVHTPWYKRKTPNSVHIPGTVLFDLEQDKEPMKYRQEYEMYADYALERYLIEKEGYDEYDAKVKVMQDYDEVKKWFQETEKISLPARSY